MIELLHGDITKVNADTIVNAANSGLLGGGGVDGAIHRAAGPELLEACRRIKKVNGVRCPAGEARITPGFNLPADWIIHTVGPRYGFDENPQQLLRNAYRSSLDLALEKNLRTIVFPAISCGVYAYPLKEAAETALSECLKEKEIQISFSLFDEAAFKVFQTVLERLT